jgi:type I restriction enzyme S subunit
MADPYLICPPDWYKGTLAPDRDRGLIVRVDTGSTPQTTNEDYWDGGIAWLTPKEITGFTENLFVSRTERTISQLGLENSSARLMPPGTVMLSKRAPVGAVAVNAVPMATNQGFMNFTCGQLLRPLYLAYWLRTNRPYLDQVANGSTYPELYISDLFEFEIAVPSLTVQDRIIELIGALQFVTALGLPLEQSVTSPESLLAMQDQNHRLSALRDAMVPLLLSGKLDLSQVRTPLVALP